MSWAPASRPRRHRFSGTVAPGVAIVVLAVAGRAAAQTSRAFPPLPESTEDSSAAEAPNAGPTTATESAPAQTETSQAPNSRGLVRVFISGDKSISARLRASLIETLGRIGVGVEIERSDRFALSSLTQPDPGALARVWIDLRAPEQAQVLVVDGRSDRILTRKRVSRAHGDELGLEQVALLVQTAVESSFDLPDKPRAVRQRPTLVESRPAPGADTPAPPLRPPSLRFPVSPRYGVRWLSPDLGASPGAGLEAGFLWARASYQPGLWLTGSRQASTERPSEEVELDVTVWSLGLMGSTRLLHSRLLDLELGVGARLYFWDLDPRGTGDAITPVRQLELDLTPGARLQASHTLSTQIALVFALGLDIDLARRDYVYESSRDGGASIQSQTLVRQAALRPLVELGFSFDVGRTYQNPSGPGLRAAR